MNKQDAINKIYDFEMYLRISKACSEELTTENTKLKKRVKELEQDFEGARLERGLSESVITWKQIYDDLLKELLNCRRYQIKRAETAKAKLKQCKEVLDKITDGSGWADASDVIEIAEQALEKLNNVKS